MFGRPMDSFGLVGGPSVGVGPAARGGTGGFFLHPTPSAAIKTITPSTPREFIVNIKILSRLCMKLLTPNWLFVLPLISKPCYCSAIRQHGPDLIRTAPVGPENQMPSIRRPDWILVTPFTMGQLIITAGGYVHQENIPVSFSITASPGEQYMLS